MWTLLYRRPKLRLTGLGPHNDSLICKLIQVCNWPCIETAGALNSKKSLSPPLSFFMNIAQPNVTHRRKKARLLRGGRPAKRQDEKKERKDKKKKKRGEEGSKNRKRKGHLDSHLDGLWCDELRLIGFPVHTREHRELICVTPSALRSAKKKKKKTRCCWSMVYLIPNLLLQPEPPPPLWFLATAE